jgi:hypothetical protein
MSLTETRVEGARSEDAAGNARTDGGPLTPRTAPGPLAVRVALPVALVGAFVAFGWTADWFREGMAGLAPHLSILLWSGVAVVLSLTLIRRLGWLPVGPLVQRRTRFLLAPSALAGSVVAYLVELFASWQNGGAAWWTVGGVVPFSDAMAYFGGAQRLLFDGQLDQFNSRRPLHTTFLASELALTNFDLRALLVLQAVLLGVGSYLAARQVARDLGPLAGLAVFAGIYGFARVLVQTVSTETLGVAMGALAFAALWSAVRDRNVWLGAGGAFVLTFALNFRPGPVLLMLTVPIALAWFLRGSRRINWRVLGLSVAAVAVGLASNYIAIYAFHGEPDNLNANANYIIYGMAKGVPTWSSNPQSWNQVDLDYPEIIEMSETERNRFVSARAREKLRSNLGTFARTYFDSGVNYIRSSAEYVTAPISSHRPVAYTFALVGAALAFVARGRSSWRRVLLDAALFGSVVLALPTFVGAWFYGDEAPWGWGAVGVDSYLPWWFGAAVGAAAYIAFILVGTERLHIGRQLKLTVATVATIAVIMPILGFDTTRLFAVAVPFLAVPFALALVVIERSFAAKDVAVAAPDTRRPDAVGPRWAPLLIGGAVAAVAVIGAPIAAVAIDKPPAPARTCPDGRRAEPVLGGSAVRLVRSDQKRDLDELEVRHVTGSPVTRWLQEHGVFGPIHADTTFVGGLNERGYDRFAFVDGAVSAPEGSVLYLCGMTISDNESNGVLRWSAVPVDVLVGSPLDATSARPEPAPQR